MRKRIGLTGQGVWPGQLALGAAAGAVLLASPMASAFDFNIDSDALGDFSFNWNNRILAGVQVRTERQNDALLDKQNVSGQSLLCAGLPGGGVSGLFNPDCQSRIGDPGPNRTLVNARGGYNINGDDGNLNYDRGDVTASIFQIRSELTGAWRNFSMKLGGLGYIDPTNNDFDEDKQDLLYPNRGVSRDTILIRREQRRRSDLENDLGNELRLLEAWVGVDFEVASSAVTLRVGNQRLRWGESNLFNFNVLDRVNPLSERLFNLPGTEVRDAFLPVGMATVAVDLTSNFNVSGFYQYDWDPTEVAPCGSFLSISDVAGCGNGPTPVYLGLGQYPEDPQGDFVPGGGDVLLDQGIRTTYLDDEQRGYPDSGGQYGIRLNYFAEGLNGGTELSLYGMNIHSRLPYLSVDAADESCLQPTPNGGNLVNNLNPCTTNPNGTPNPNPLRSSFPISTVNPFLDYPEDIHIYGLSATTNAGNWSLAGEFAFSPNQPAQVAFADVFFAGLQPAFPDTPQGFERGDLIDGENAILLPTNRVAVPDFLETRFRGNDVQAGDTIRGFERLKIGQVDFTGIRVFGGGNLISADQIILVAEVAAVHAFDMPGINELQFEGGSAQLLHFSEGANEFDPAVDAGRAPGDPSCPDPNAGCRTVGPTDRINPERADRDNFADDFATGYRLRVDATYNDAILGVGVTPRLEFFHDVYGTSIFSGQDFVEDRKRLTLGTDFLFTDSLSGNISYRFYWGAGYRNTRLDRDYAEAYLSYAF